MSASFVVHTPRNKCDKTVNHGQQIQDYLLSYDQEMRSAADYNGEKLFCGIATEIYLNDCAAPLALEDMTSCLSDGDILHVIHRPHGFDPYTIAIAAVVAAVAAVALIEPPSLPRVNGQDVGGRSESPNNRLSGQTNVARPYEEIPEVFGKIVAYPDLIQPSLFEYVNNIKFVREVFCIGVGFYDFGDIRDGQTLISDIPDASATVYNPGTSPPNLQIGRASNDVDGQELGSFREFNGRIIFIDRSGSEPIGTATFFSGGFIEVSNLDLAWRLELQSGDTFTVAGTTSNNGTFTAGAITFNESSNTLRIAVSQTVIGETSSTAVFSVSGSLTDAIYVYDPLLIENLELNTTDGFTVLNTASNNGSYTLTSSSTVSITPSIDQPAVQVTELRTTTSFSNEDDSSATIRNPEDRYVGWFQLPGEMDQIWAHFQAPQGLQDQNGNSTTVEIDIETQQTDASGTPTGSVSTDTISITSGSLDPIFRTEKITVPSKGFYRIRARRVTERLPGNAVDLIKWEEVFAVENYTSNFGNVTLLDVTTRATAFALNSSRREINAVVTRRLGTARSGTFVPTLLATQSFADAALYVLMNAGRDISEIDIDELYDIERSINSQLAEFNFSFDNENIDLGSRITTICNAARVSSYRDGQIWRFVRDEARANRTLTFNRRNIASGENQHQSMQLRRPNDFNGVTLRYTDPATNRRAEINISINASSQTFVEGQIPSKPMRINLAGCRNVLQARDRAHLEVRKLLFQRRRVTDIVLNDGNLVDLGDRVSWVDIYDGDTFDGEILSRDGNTFRTSERFTPATGEIYVVTITDSSGNTTAPVSCTPVSGNEFAFIADVTTNPIIADGVNIQAGSRYLIGNVADVADSDFTVISKQPQPSDRVRVEMVNYTDDLYEMDGNL